MFKILGGTYLELCIEPQYRELYGSGLRAAVALSNTGKKISFTSCIGKDKYDAAKSICDNFNIVSNFKLIEETVSFHYYHPLSSPIFQSSIFDRPKVSLPDIDAENILYYGMIEATAKVSCDFAVYDAQNSIGFRETESTAEHLAILVNQNEARLISGLKDSVDLEQIGRSLLESQGAEVVVIKNGSSGALVIEDSGIHKIPVFATSAVWPIGSGDIFSAAFAWKWMLEKESAFDSAMYASRFTAYYCESRLLPLPTDIPHYEALSDRSKKKKIYLAGPFFNIAERWLINEVRSCLLSFGNQVFSPFHDVGFGESLDIACQDLEGIKSADVIFAIVNGLDPGTLFEVGYARAIGKRVVLLAENINEVDLLMLEGSNCEITNDLSTAVYKASW
ncbi:nucleoside 2-deoxyribosyltransferase [Chitinophaga agrisoli]|uniref:Nucleoside 2-deoxyribosyltransferase n=1 Tax=Chitinophaga agrisoli TaxID=2607653 RepID=A0A5B2VIQ6_9BACT|nr:PfkB family carbohydrate kinase [Chitinophaga agrisoli]KAA2238805.1 nucleoside 2-deoxyribosyltransferase [Chitinophaga agrisoli]